MDELYKQIKTALETDCHEIRWIDQDEGQLDDWPEGYEPLSYPAALINLEDSINYKTIAGGKQIARTDFRIKLAFKVYEGAHKGVPNDNYFTHYEIVKKVTALIVTNLKQCRRINTSKKNKRKDVDPLKHVLTFRISYLDVNT